jgi:hypothetical protein
MHSFHYCFSGDSPSASQRLFITVWCGRSSCGFDQAKNPGLALTFLLYQRRREIQQESGAAASGLSAIDRIALTKSKKESELSTLRARKKQVCRCLAP